MYKSAKKKGGVLTKLLYKPQARRQKDGDIIELTIFKRQNGKLAKNRGGVLYIYTLFAQ